MDRTQQMKRMMNKELTTNLPVKSINIHIMKTPLPSEENNKITRWEGRNSEGRKCMGDKIIVNEVFKVIILSMKRPRNHFVQIKVTPLKGIYKIMSISGVKKRACQQVYDDEKISKTRYHLDDID